MTPTLGNVLGLLYGIALGGALGMSLMRMTNALGDPKPAAKPVSFFEALDKVLHRSVMCLAFTFVIMWFLQSPGNTTDDLSLTLLVSTDPRWRMYVFLSVFGVSLVWSALEFFLGAVLQRIGQLISASLVRRFKVVKP